MGREFKFRLLLLLLASASIAQAKTYIPCSSDPARQAARSAELQKIEAADQADRKMFEAPKSISSSKLLKMGQRDVLRRQRVGEIFGEGCFRVAADYAAAALVYQHGDMPDHSFQAFVWAKRAVDLGDNSQRSLVGLAIDRYLVKTRHKALFGSESHPSDTGDLKSCYCMAPVEASFPDSLRMMYIGRTLQEALDYTLRDHINAGKNCPNTFCDEELTASPQGTVPGLW